MKISILKPIVGLLKLYLLNLILRARRMYPSSTIEIILCSFVIFQFVLSTREVILYECQSEDDFEENDEEEDDCMNDYFSKRRVYLFNMGVELLVNSGFIYMLNVVC